MNMEVFAMRKIMIGLALAAVCLFAGFTDGNPNTARGKKIREIKDRLEQVETKYVARIDYRERREALRLMDQIVADLESLAMENPPQKPALQIVSRERFNALLYSLGKEMNAEKKKCLVLKAAIRWNFSMDQVARLVASFTWDDDRLEIIEALLPKIVDREKSHALLDSLTFDGSRTKLKKMLDESATGTD